METLSEIPHLLSPREDIDNATQGESRTSRTERNFERYKFIPMRLTEDERVLLSILENALNVSEYTDTVDVFARKPKSDRIISGLVDILSISSGLMVSNNLTKGENLMKTNSLANNIGFFRDMFEIGRRYKIMNPSKMRETYGKMMFILQDTETHIVKSETGLSFIKDILTVSVFLNEKNGLDLLSDPLLEDATCTIDNSSGEKTRDELQSLSQRKQDAINELVKKHTTDTLSSCDIVRVLDSISDNNAYLSFNVSPVDRMIRFLRTYFNPNSPPDEPLFTLELDKKTSSSRLNNRNSFGNFYGYSQRYFGGGACLSHDHRTQFTFVLQSLCLWKETMMSMPRLWLLADQDMLTEYYRLSDTGQGYHRVQSCPRVGGEMRRILRHVQQNVGQPWVGLSVVHLGDRDVPNALVFIDKYCQVPRILGPIAACLENLPLLIRDSAFHEYVRNEWGSIDGLRMQIMSDFFKHGFDGSGDDGGSCIDGRLTSAWNWCSKLHKKPYYHVFMFTGFQGFDGDWKED